MTRQIDHRRLDLVLLARMYTPGKTVLSRRMLVKAIEPFFHGHGGGRLAELVEARLASMRESGLVEETIHRPTDAGKKVLAKTLGMRRAERWDSVKRRRILALVLGLDPKEAKSRDCAGSIDRVRARLLRQRFGVPKTATPTLRQAVDALVCRQLGLPGEKPTWQAVRELALRQALGTDAAMNDDGLARLLAAREAGAPNTEDAAVRNSLMTRWLESISKEEDLESFARLIQRVLEEVPQDGKFGENRVFIAAAWRAFLKRGEKLELPEFKSRLVAANREGLLRLHRADLVGAMDPHLVRESESRYLNATFHFIEFQPGQPT